MSHPLAIVWGMRIADLPEKARPRERLEAGGPAALSDQELIALLLRTGARGRNAVDVAADLLSQSGSLLSLSMARVEELARVAGLGEAKGACLVAAFELGRRAGNDGPTAPVIKRVADIVSVVRPRLGDLRREEAHVVVVNSRNRPVKIERLATGDGQACFISVRDVLATTLRHDGSGLALVHTHPSGDPSPSGDDIVATLNLMRGAEAAELRFLEHVVIAGRRWQGLIDGGYVEAPPA